MPYHFYEVVDGPGADAFIESIIAFAENLDAWTKVTTETGFTLVVVEPSTATESAMLDLAFGSCEKY